MRRIHLANPRFRPTRGLLLVGASLLALAAPAAAQGPTGGAVARGKATISATAERSTIRQKSRRAIIDWKGFDVGRGHEVVFDQPGKRAATLNRVAGGKRSVVAGAIRAPGTVVIQNTAGVIFIGSARIDTGGLVATSQTVDAEQFRDGGRLAIGGGEAADARVVNDGRVTIRGKGLAALVGRDVANAGAIVVDRGTALLASGARTTLDLGRDGVMRIVVAGDAEGAGRGVTNSGLIDARRIVLSAGAAASTLDAAINTTGVIRAASATRDGGTIEFVARGDGAVRIAGAIDASGGRHGGTLTATGATVEIASPARIDVSGGRAGGVVHLGGGVEGNGPLRRADHLRMAAGARIAADGGLRGGEVVLWSDGSTVFDGAITASSRDRGGFVETSGKFALGVGESASVDAGVGGRWLLDPRNVIIGGGPNNVPPGGGTVNPPAGSVLPYTISSGSIIAALNRGNDVTITTEQPAVDNPGTIIVNNPVNWMGAGDFALIADSTITVNANIESNGAGGLRMAAGGNVSIAGGSGNRVVRTTSGPLEITADGNVVLQRINTQPSNIQVYSESGSVDVTAGGEIRLQGGTTGGRWVRLGRLGDSADITLTAPTITVQGGAATNNFSEVVVGAGGSITMTADQINVLNGTGDQGRVFAYGQAPLTMLAEAQTWTGPIRAGDGNLANLGGDVTISGAVDSAFQPIFSLAPNRNFTHLPAGPDGTPSSYAATTPLTITTSGTGTIEIAGPTSATDILLESAERVGLGPSASLTASDPGTSLVVAAGRQFRNDAGADALAAGGLVPGRWLVYVDSFVGMVGTEPAPREFDLYGRLYADAPPDELEAFAGNRIVYGEAPTLTVTADDLSKIYGTAITPTFTLTGLRSGDSEATAFDTPPTVASDGAPADADVGVYASVVTAAASSQGYLLNLVDGTLSVTAAALSVTANEVTREYGGQNPTFTATFGGFVLGQGVGDLGGALAFTTPATAASDVGVYTITPGGLTSSNYAISFVDGTLTVDPAALTVTANNASRSYGAANPLLSASLDGFVLGQGVGDLGGALAFTTPATGASNVGVYTITPGGLTSGNYAISFLDGALSVTPAPLRVVADNERRLYGDPNPIFTANFDGFVAGDGIGDLGGALAFATPATRSSNVGAYGVTPSGLTSTNYVLAFAPGTLTVDPRPLTLVINDQSRLYGSTNPVLTWTARGFVLGQDSSVVTGAPTTSATQSSNVGGYAITRGTLAAANYVLPATTGTLTVAPVTLTLVINDQSRTYGALNPPLTWTASGFVLEQTDGVVTGAPATAATQTSDAETYTISRGTLGAQNYILPDATAALRIDPAPLTVTANDAARPAGQANPPFTARFSEFVLDQDPSVLRGVLSFATDAATASPPGDYTILPSGLYSDNYDIAFAPGLLTVDAAPIPPDPGTGGVTLPSLANSLEIVGRGVPPFTPGDSAFRTTRAEAPIARDSTFRLTYSLGEIIQLIPPGAGAADGFAPAAGGFVPAAGSAAAPVAVAGCSGPIALGTTAACGRATVTESFWSTTFPGTIQ